MRWVHLHDPTPEGNRDDRTALSVDVESGVGEQAVKPLTDFGSVPADPSQGFGKSTPVDSNPEEPVCRMAQSGCSPLRNYLEDFIPK